MRVRAVVPGAVTACAVALAGCGGGDEVRTVTVTTSAAVPGTTTAPAPRSPREPGTSTAPRSTTAPAPPATTTTTATTDRPTPTGTTRTPTPVPDRDRDEEPRVATVVADDPVGGTTIATGRAAGTGYSVRVPDGWYDGAQRFDGSSIDFDLVYVKGRGSGITTNILIVREAGSGVRGRSVDELRSKLRRRIEDASGGAPVTAGPERRVDGENAITFAVRRRIGDTEIVQRQVAVVRDGALYTVGLNALRASARDDERVFSSFLRSWRWR